ncbi:hypothetical protein [Kitasatospora cineracea]|uniref:hypothetical protein n=1 Tax=Kitasatospora cineracea TaxID=88074 RepID=UPI003819941B
MSEEIEHLGDLVARTLLIGGNQELPGLARVPADASLRHALGGTLTSLNVRMAAAWLERCTAAQLTSAETFRAWRTWAAAVAKRERYDRRPLSDKEVIDFIRKSLALHPGCSRTRLLRELRGQGLACEQKRFADLYTATVENE